MITFISLLSAKNGLMPHFIIDSSEDIIKQRTPDEIMTAVFGVANASGLFTINDVKVRLCPYQYYQLGGGKSKLPIG